jgi:hypothetical protein
MVISEGKYYTPTLSDKMTFHGVYGGHHEYFFEEFNKGIETSNIQIFWEDFLHREQNNIFNMLSPDSYKISFESLNPTRHPDFWSRNLNDKKVLIIHQFENTIRFQYNNKDKIWQNEHYGKIPDLSLFTYKPVWVLGQEKPHKSWRESLQYMKDGISKIDFDVAILACSYFSMPLLNFIKTEMGKSCIYMGGQLQILFGIKGFRWDDNQANGMYNENWVRCFSEDLPDPNSMLVTDTNAYF